MKPIKTLRKPIKTLRKGNLTASLFSNKTPKGKFYLIVNISRGWKGRDGKWHNSNITITLNQIAWIIHSLEELRGDGFKVIDRNQRKFKNAN